MPGNETLDRSQRTYFPAEWVMDNVPAGQTTPVAMGIPGVNQINSLPLLDRATLRAVVIKLSAPVTAGFIRFQLTRNGSQVGPQVDMAPGDGTVKQWELAPGDLVANKGDEIGLVLGTPPTLAPAASIEALVLLGIEFVG
jgi:hypothetical protein